MQVDTQFNQALFTFLKNINVDPVLWLSVADNDLYTLFVKLKESRKISHDVFNQMVAIIELKNPTQIE